MKIEREINVKQTKELDLPQGEYYYKISENQSPDDNYFHLFVNDQDESFSWIKVSMSYAETVISRREEVFEPHYLITYHLFGVPAAKGENITKEEFQSKLKEAITLINGEL